MPSSERMKKTVSIVEHNMLRPKFGAFIFAWLVALSSVGADAQTSDLVSKSALRVCADPANPPMSDKDGSGFENKIAQFFDIFQKSKKSYPGPQTDPLSEKNAQKCYH